MSKTLFVALAAAWYVAERTGANPRVLRREGLGLGVVMSDAHALTTRSEVPLSALAEELVRERLAHHREQEALHAGQEEHHRQERARPAWRNRCVVRRLPSSTSSALT